MTLREGLAEQINTIKLVDTHEHIRLLPTEDAERGIWALFAGHYLYASLHLAGAPLDAFEQRPGSPEQEYEVIAPYLDAVQTTAYFRHVWTSLQTAFGVQESQLSAGLYVDLDQKLRAVQEDPVWIKHLLKEVAGIERALLDTHWAPALLDVDRELFDPVLRVNAFVMCPWEDLREHNDTSIWDYQDLLSVTVKSFASFLELFDAMLDRHCQGGARAIKVALAYERSLEFLPVEASLAEQIWNAGHQEATAEQRKALEDFLVFYAVGEARDRGLPVQVHTGMLEGLKTYRLTRVRPSLLVPLLSAYPDVGFDLFHAGFPFARELAVIALSWPNVWADICWAPLVSPTAAVRILEEYIDIIPGNKLLWGGDCIHPVSALGAAITGRQVVTEALARKLEAGAFTEPQALRLAECILHDNAAELYYSD